MGFNLSALGNFGSQAGPLGMAQMMLQNPQAAAGILGNLGIGVPTDLSVPGVNNQATNPNVSVGNNPALSGTGNSVLNSLGSLVAPPAPKLAPMPSAPAVQGNTYRPTDPKLSALLALMSPQQQPAIPTLAQLIGG